MQKKVIAFFQGIWNFLVWNKNTIFIGLGIIAGIGAFIGFQVWLLSMSPSTNPLMGVPLEGRVYGFWYGVANGLTLAMNLIASYFSDNWTIYQVHNTGFGYNFGFFLGTAFSFKIIISSTSKKN